jgi:hypothetical protein
LRTLEALLDAVEEPRSGVVAVHVEGLPREGATSPESIDYELTDADDRVMAAVQVKARAAGTKLGAGEVFRALAALVRDRDAARYGLLVSADPGPSAQSLMRVLRSGLSAAQTRAALEEVLASLSAERQLSVLRDLKDEHIERLSRAQVSFDQRDEEEIIGQVRTRLRRYRNHARAGLGERSAGLLIGYLVAEIFRRAADVRNTTMRLEYFRRLLLADGAAVARALGRRDWGVLVGPLPAAPEVRRADLLARVEDALPLVPEGIEVPNCRLTGLSGIGKTSLAAGYVFERADVYDVIFWADAESEMTLTSSFSQIYRELCGRDRQVPDDPRALRDEVLTELCCSTGRWLLILDNCLDLRAVDEWVPRAGLGHVIVTSTDSASPPWASTSVPVTSMDDAQAEELLRRGLGLETTPNAQQHKLLDMLAKELEYWPLALKLACAYLYGSYGIDGIPEYLRKVKVASLGNPALVPPRYPRPLIQAIALCVQRIRDDAASPKSATSLAAAYSLAVLRISGYLSSKQIPVHLVLSAAAIGPGQDAFRSTGPIMMDDTIPPAADVVRILRAQSLVEVDERLPAGLCADEGCQCGFTMQVNCVIQEVAQDAFDRDPATGGIIDRLAWHTEKWLRAAIDGGAHDRALILAAHAEAIEGHASRVNRESDFVAFLRGQLAVIYGKQNMMGEGVRLLRAEISQFTGRGEEYSQLLACQARIQLAAYLAAILLNDGVAPAEMTVTVDDIASLLEDAYSYVHDFHTDHLEGAAYLISQLRGAVQDLRLNGADHERLTLLDAEVQNLASRLPHTEISWANQISQQMVDCMDELRDVPRATELARELLEWLGDANTHESAQLRCHARKVLVEALTMTGDLEAALAEFDRFVADAQPPSLYVRELEYLVHNVGMKCVLLGWAKVPKAAEMLSRLLSDGRAELVRHAFPGQGEARVSLLCGVQALHRGDLKAVRMHVGDFRSLDHKAFRGAGPQKVRFWYSLAGVLNDVLDVDNDRTLGFPRSPVTRHEYSGVGRFVLLSLQLQSGLLRCTPGCLPLWAVLAALYTSRASLIGTQSVLTCHLLQGALKNLGIRSSVVAAIARVEDKRTGAVQHLGTGGRTPVLRRDGRTEGYAVLWSKSLHRMIDPAVALSQNLHPINPDEDFTLSGPVVLPISAIHVVSGTTNYPPARITRGPLSISWEPQPRWTQGITPIPGSDLAASLNFGSLALATAALELVRGVSALGLRSDMSQMTAGRPSLARLVEGREQLANLPDTPPEMFLSIFDQSV